MSTSATLLVVSFRDPYCHDNRVSWTIYRAADDKPRYAVATLDGPKNIQSALTDEENWWRELDSQVHGGQPPVVLIHGFNNSQEQAIQRGFALRALLCPPGTTYKAIRTCPPARPVIVLTWPSNENGAEYTWDEGNEEWVSGDAVRAILSVVQRYPGTILVAHSMGNRILIDAALAARRKGLRIGRLILASADVDRARFARLIGSREAALMYPATVYASRNDQALTLSWRAHGYPRAGDLSYWVNGQAPGYPYQQFTKNVEIVDTTDAHAGLLAHAAFIESPEGAADLCHVLAGDGPGQMPGRTLNEGGYWNLVKGGGKDDMCAVRAFAAATIANGRRLPDR